MTISTATIDHFISDQVQNGSADSIETAEEEVSARIYKRQLDKKLANAEKQIEEGEYREMTEESNLAFVKKLEDRLLPK